jgi:hypothetical protein
MNLLVITCLLYINADCLLKDWNVPVYAFFNPVPSINYVGNPARCAHVFKCNVKGCKGKGLNQWHVWRYLDTANRKLTSNLYHHAKICWGEEAVAGADAAKLHGAAYKIIEKLLRMQDGSIIAMFKHVKGNGKVAYSHKQHIKTRAWYTRVCLLTHNADKVVSAEMVRWVAKSMHPFKIVND